MITAAFGVVLAMGLLGGSGIAQQDQVAHPVPTTLWVADIGFFSELNRHHIGRSGHPPAALDGFVNIDVAGGIGGFTFDAAGNLWISLMSGTSDPGGAILAFRPGALRQLASGHNARAAVVIVNPAGGGTLSEPAVPRFDNSGNLWFGNAGNQICEYAAAQLSVSSDSPPVRCVDSPHIVSAIAFDGAGDLWVTDSLGEAPQFEGEVYEFTPDQLAAGGSQSPNYTITTVSPEPGVVFNPFRPVALAFDGSGNLWVAYKDSGPGELDMFPAASLANTGTVQPSPSVVVTGFGSPMQLAFDDLGGLWVGVESDEGDEVIRFSSEQLLASGSPTPAITLESNLARHPRHPNFSVTMYLTLGPWIP